VRAIVDTRNLFDKVESLGLVYKGIGK
jgi:hypothetical protein